MRNRNSHSRKKAHQRGLRAEFIAKLYLRILGYHVLQSRYRTKIGEIDIIAKRAGTLVLVEVKRRPTKEAGINALTAKTQQRISAAGRSFLSRNEPLANLGLRYDLIVITKWHLYHFRDAWRD